MGILLKPEEMNALMADMDFDGNGELDLNEFLMAVHQRSRIARTAKPVGAAKDKGADGASAAKGGGLKVPPPPPPPRTPPARRQRKATRPPHQALPRFASPRTP